MKWKKLRLKRSWVGLLGQAHVATITSRGGGYEARWHELEIMRAFGTLESAKSWCEAARAEARKLLGVEP